MTSSILINHHHHDDDDNDYDHPQQVAVFPLCSSYWSFVVCALAFGFFVGKLGSYYHSSYCFFVVVVVDFLVSVSFCSYFLHCVQYMLLWISFLLLLCFLISYTSVVICICCRGEREFLFPVIPGNTSLKLPFPWHLAISLPVPGKRKFWPGIKTGNTIIICSFADGWSRPENKSNLEFNLAFHMIPGISRDY